MGVTVPSIFEDDPGVYLSAGFYFMIALQPDSFQVNHKPTTQFSGSKIGLLQNEDWKIIIYLLTLK